MAFLNEDSQEAGPECPVCYECLSGTERTLSCGHAFCHDCLVKTLISINSGGNIRETLVCPICRHLTFIKKQREALSSDKDRNDGQILEVPLSLRPGERKDARRTSLPGVSGISHCVRGICERVRRQKLVSPGNNESQVFVISAEGRPMAEGEVINVVRTAIPPQRRRRRRICTTSRCLVVLLVAFTLLAMVAAVLPWLLLA
ncbi:RING finger protein 222 [Brachionichthys hirsutus]|uniref:RING finger protein 222 n=1 Tax=Brachionichthys hirsutus TaxID=412623 RepID=UPI003604A020